MIRSERFSDSRRLWAGLALLPLLLAACAKDKPNLSGEDPKAQATVPQPTGPAAAIPAGGLPPREEPPVAPRVVTYEVAESAYQAGEFREAKALFESYVSSKPENPWGHYMLGLSAWKSGDLARAEAAFDRALELDPKHAKSLINSARVLIEQDREPEAIERLNLVLKDDSTSSDALRLVARARHRLGDVAAAVDTYRKALIYDERDLWAMNNLGVLYFEEGEYESALPPLARAVQLRPTSPVFQNNLGMVLEHAGHVVAAKQSYEAAVKADSTYAKAIKNRDRLSLLQDSPAASEVDLSALAELFRQQVRMWQGN